ncbi:MAG: hypothetical protein NXI22_14275 [bacterium]|nr:hypothetical protein [bacterium]
MAENPPLADLLDSAGEVFKVAYSLGSDFREIGQTSIVHYERQTWEDFAPRFEQFAKLILKLAPVISKPPSEFHKVAEQLMRAATAVKEIRDAVLKHGGFADYLDYGFRLLDVSHKGWEAIDAVRGPTSRDPFAFVNEGVQESSNAFERVDGEIRLNAGIVSLRGLLLDQIVLGPRPGFANRFPISDFDAKVVKGDIPTVCPKTDRPLPVEWLPKVVEVFQRVGLCKEGETIHWVGSQSKLENFCTCFDDDTLPTHRTQETSKGDNSTKPRKRRGRKSADEETQGKEASLVKAWVQARESKVSKVDFARDAGYNLKEFNKILDRVAQRKKRADK